MQTFQKLIASLLSLTLCLSLSAPVAFAENTSTGADVTPTLYDDSSNDDLNNEDENESSDDNSDEEASNNAEENIEDSSEAIEDATEIIENGTTEEGEIAIETIEAEIKKVEETLNQEMKKGSDVSLPRNVIAKIKTLIFQLKKAKEKNNRGEVVRLSVQIRNLVRDLKRVQIKATLKIKAKQIQAHQIKNQPMLSIRWGQVQKPASGATITTDSWNGSVTIENGKIYLINPILFEPGDKVTSNTKERIDFNSNITNHFDGLLIKVFPDADGTYTNTKITVTFTKHTGLNYTKEDFQSGKFKSLIDENGKGIIIEKKAPGEVAIDVLKTFGTLQNEIKNILEKINIEHQDDLQWVLSNMDEDAQKKLIKRHEKLSETIEKMLKHLPYVPQEKRDELLAEKLAVLDDTEELEEVIEKIKNIRAEYMQKLIEVKEEIESYNFDPKTAAKLRIKIKDFVRNALKNGSTASEIETGIQELIAITEEYKSEAVNEKYAEGIIPFKDTDDDNWFTQYVAYVKNKNIVSGYKDDAGNALGEFRPANNVTLAEMLKMALETAELGGDSTGTPQNMKAVNHWAKKYYKKAENLGLSLVDDINADPSTPATRGDVIRLVLEALGITPEDVTKTDFSDVSLTDANVDYIQYAKLAGVISGDAGKTTFRPNDPVNRAEVAKILKNMIEILKSAADVAE